MKDQILKELNEAKNVIDKFINDDAIINAIEESAKIMTESIDNGGKIISCGNGGSMCDAMHFAEELTGKFREERSPIPAVSISDPSHITCVGNDYGFDAIFSRYVESVGNTGDVLLAISTSGRSTNVIRAAEVANRKGIKVVAKKLNISTENGKGYRALANVGENGGQEVPHLHFHLFGGEKVGKMVE